MEDLQQKWKHLYATQLPEMARNKDEAQPHWPVRLDHCFARIVLDNALGAADGKPWMEVVKAPAIKHMTESQLKAAIDLAEAVASGTENLNELNEKSLDLRGKSGPSKKRKAKDQRASTTSAHPNTADSLNEKSNHSMTNGSAKRPKRTESGNISTYFLPSPQSPKKDADPAPAAGDAVKAMKAVSQVDMDVQLRRIADSKLTAFRKQTLSMLCQVPRGRYSTYQAMSDFITAKSHKTCARAVGNAMRNNPFAPEVPCHRILAADGTLGGFAGHWGEDGKFAKEKHKLLHEEGVRFDSRGKVKGPPFKDFEMVT